MQTGERNCFDMVNVTQKGTDKANTGRQVVVPKSIFSCNGTITHYFVSLDKESDDGDYPCIQVWRPGANKQYKRINEYIIEEKDIKKREDDYYLAEIEITGTTIEFQSGDVIGYYQPSTARYTVWSIQTSGYISYDKGGHGSSFSLNGANKDDDRQPLIQVTVGTYDCIPISVMISIFMTICIINNR